jgi:hypothetical protein
MTSKLADAGTDIKDSQFLPRMGEIILLQFGMGKFASNKKNEPTINKGVEIKKPSRIAIKYLFSPMTLAKGVKTFSNQFKNFCISYSSYLSSTIFYSV